MIKKRRKKIPDYVKIYGKEIGLPNLELDYENICNLTFDGKINISIVYYEKIIYILLYLLSALFLKMIKKNYISICFFLMLLVLKMEVQHLT